MRELLSIIFILAIVVALAYAGYYWLWPGLVSIFEWVIGFFGMVLTWLFYILTGIFIVIVLALVVHGVDRIMKVLEIKREALRIKEQEVVRKEEEARRKEQEAMRKEEEARRKEQEARTKKEKEERLSNEIRRFNEFCRTRGALVGRCGGKDVAGSTFGTGTASGTPAGSVVTFRAVLASFGIIRSVKDITNRLNSYGERRTLLDPQCFSSCLLTYGIPSEIVHTEHDVLLFRLWQAFNEHKIAVMLVNWFRLNNPDKNVKRTGGNFDHMIIATGMKIGYAGDLLICFRHHKVRDGHVKLLEGPHLISCVHKSYVVAGGRSGSKKKPKENPKGASAL